MTRIMDWLWRKTERIATGNGFWVLLIYLIVIAVLLWRPRGLFGAAAA